MRLLKQNAKGAVFQADHFKIFYRKKNSISGDNAENKKETIYFIHGTAEITLKKKTWTIHAPEKIIFPAKTYHKIKALTSISFIVF
jgi:mannose-6-phosphate isomerase-like protein (cupin superfamily)